MWAKGNRRRPDVKPIAMERAKKLFDQYFNRLIPYVWRTRIKKDLGNNAIQIIPSDTKELGLIKKKYLKDFRGVLNDALA